VVLGAVAPEMVDAGLGLLREGGRYLEMGARERRTDAEVEASHPGVRYRAFELGEAGPQRLQAIFAELVHGFEAGRFAPVPVRVFPTGEAAAAFRFMSRGEHVGKLALLPSVSTSDGTVLITGGLGALGLLVARWLVEVRRTKRVVLVGRCAPTEEAAGSIEELRALGAEISVASADITDRDALQAVLHDIPADRPLRGVVHAAGVLDDGVMQNLDEARFAKVLAPKVHGAWNLHELTEEADLGFFVMFSSTASLLGSAGQANYAAANAFLDGLAYHRRAKGLVAKSINWGPWSGAGMATRMAPADLARLERYGFGALDTEQGLSMLRSALAHKAPELAVLSLDTRRMQKAWPSGAAPVVFSELIAAHASPRRAASSSPAVDRLEPLAPSERHGALTELLAECVASVLALPSSAHVSPDRPLQEMGLDSLMAVELRNKVSDLIGQPLAATLMFDYPTVGKLAEHLLSDVLALGAAPSPEQTAFVAVSQDEPIAIVGMGCRFPGGVTDPESYWSLLDAGVDAIAEVPPDRWDIDEVYDPDPSVPGTMMTRSMGFVRGLDQFDPAFFDIAPREAKAMDPQHRLLLETSWEALERAGIQKDALVGSATGVFFGIISHDYERVHQVPLEMLHGYFATGSAASVASGRMSYLFGLTGPSMTVDTACSSSLVTTHLACQSLRSGECDLAVAGGATVVLTPELHVEFSRLRGLAPDGRCKSFDASADGVAWSEGCGALVLKRLSDAERDGDPVVAVIRGTAVNQDGRSQGLTAPNGPSQQAVIRSALAQAGLQPSDIDYVEAHGTGTALGDPIEMQALGAVARDTRTEADPLLVGSVKSNFGHTQAAAGVAGIIKTVLAMQHGKIPRSLHFDTPSPHIPWADLPVRVVADAVEWPRRDRARTAGVSSFGISGTNAHVVLSEGPRQDDTAPAEPSTELVVLSARTETALRAQAARLAAHLEANSALGLRDVAVGLASERTHFERRAAFVCSTSDALLVELRRLGHRKIAEPVVGKKAFVVPGRWSPGTAAALYRSEPVFAEAIDACAAIVSSELKLESLMFEASSASHSAVAQLSLAHASSALWQSWGVRPDVVLGYGVGSLAAAVIAGAVALEDAFGVAMQCDRVTEDEPTALLAVAASESTVTEAIAGSEGSLVAVHGPAHTVISGPAQAIAGVEARLAATSVETVRLDSANVPAAAVGHLRALKTSEARIPMVDPSTGSIGRVFTSKHVTAPSRLAPCVDALNDFGVRSYVEIGAQSGLLPMIAALLPDDVQANLLPSVSEPVQADEGDPVGADRTALCSLGRYFATGGSIDWATFVSPRGGNRVPLPTYAFQRKRFWHDAPPVSQVATTAVDGAADAELWSQVDAQNTSAVADLLSGAGPLSDDARAVLPEILAALSGRRRELTKDAEVQRWQYAPTWRFDAPADVAVPEAAGAWVVLTDEGGLAERVAAGLEAHGGRCTRIAAVPALQFADDGAFAVDASQPEAVRAVLGDVLADLKDVRGVICAWDLGAALHAVQAVLTAEIEAPPKLWFVTKGAVSVGPSDRLVAPEQSMLWGFGRSVALEHPQHWGGLVDLPETIDDDDVQRVVTTIAEASEDQVAVRTGGRFVERLTRYQPVAAPSPWSASGTVLVTGGLGALGLHVARWLIEQGAEHLVLTSRRGLAAPGAADAVASLEAAGARVTVTQADVADREAMASVLADLDGLSAVFHVAGVLDDGVLGNQTAERFAGVARPKVDGARVLHELTRDQGLDAFVLFSSATAALGSPAQSSYAAANAYLDALAHQRRQDGLAATSLGWGPWSGGGMITSAIEAASARRGLKTLAVDDGLRTLARSITAEVPHLVLANVDWSRFRMGYEALGPRLVLAELEGAPEAMTGTSELARSLERSPLAQRRAKAVQWLREQVADVIGAADPGEVDPLRGFFELGMDSLMAVDLRNRMQAELRIAVEATVAFEFPNVDALAGWILTTLELDVERASPSAEATPETPTVTEAPVASEEVDDELAARVKRLEALLE